MERDHKRSADLVRLIAGLSSVPPATIEHLLERSEAFREMCEEYERCREMVSRWRSTLPKHLSRIDEFESLSRGIESEIARFLQQPPDDDSSA